MKFCPKCSSILKPQTHTGELFLHCRCGEKYPSDPKDTLRYEEHLETAESGEKYAVFIEKSAFDQAGHKVAKPCPSCHMPYTTMIYIGDFSSPLYVCVCGKKFKLGELTSADTSTPAEE
jgi:DNA-directed RNA polymerase subunit M/transcription elongation factor TFIIS